MDRRTFLQASALGAFGADLGLVSSAGAKTRTSVTYRLPAAQERRIAWTVDDGVDEATVSGYLNLLKDNPQLKLTFFVTSAYQTWNRHANTINDLIATGQVELGNHTHTHQDLTRVSRAKARQELATCKRFLQDHFDVSGAPFYRPPYGYFNSVVREIAADLGYTNTVMWFGTLADSGVNTQRGLLRNAKRWMNDRAILISHANHPQVLDDFEQILQLLDNRNLQTVTLSEAL